MKDSHCKDCGVPTSSKTKSGLCLSCAHKGQICTDETKKKLSAAKQLRKATLGYFNSPEVREKIRIANIGKKASPETKLKQSLKKKGVKRKPMTLETRRKFAEVRRGEKSHLWKGGARDKNRTIRDSLEYRLWREAVFKRDDFTCQFCKRRGGRLEADHIKPFSRYPELRFDINNGRTLCEPCHRLTDTYGNRMRHYAK